MVVVGYEGGKLVVWKFNILFVWDGKFNEVEWIICLWLLYWESDDGCYVCIVFDRVVRFWLKEIFVVYSFGKDDKCNVFVFLVVEVSWFFL